MANYGVVGASLPSAEDIGNVVGFPVDATAAALRRVGVQVPQDPVFGSQNVTNILRKYSDFYGSNGPFQSGIRDAFNRVGSQPSMANMNALAAPLHGKQVPGMRASEPQDQPTPSFSQWIASQLPSGKNVADTASGFLGLPADMAASMLHRMGVPVQQQSVPLGYDWWQNAINNPSVTWDQVRAALQSPSMHSMRGIGGLF